MKIYNYHPDTHEYLSSAHADVDPLDPDNHLIPAHATSVAVPIIKNGEAAIFSEATQTWSVVPDFRGQTLYDQTTGDAVVIEDLGAFENLVAVKPQPTQAQLAAQLAANKIAALASVDQFHAETVQQLAGNPTQVEKDTWAMKLATANAVAANAPVSGEGNAFMTAAGMTAPTLQLAWAAKVQANAAKFAGLVGMADALRSQAKSAIINAADQAALDAVQVANKAAALEAIAALPKA